MADIKTLTSLLTTIFLLIMAGYLMARAGILPGYVREPLTNMVIDFILPSNIISSFLVDFSPDILKIGMQIMLVSIAVLVLSFIVGAWFYSGYTPKEKTVLRYGTIISNAGFLGSPIAQGLYGSLGLLYASIYLIPVRIVMWSEGVVSFTGKKDRQLLKHVLTHPCIIAVFVGILLMVTQVPLPAGIENTIRTAGNCNTALCMIVIGHILSDIKLKEVFCRTALWFCLVRLLIIPLLVYAGCRLTGIDETVTAVSTVLAGMPAPASAAMLAAKYHGEEQLAVKIICLSTLLSLGTIPLLCTLMYLLQ